MKDGDGIVTGMLNLCKGDKFIRYYSSLHSASHFRSLIMVFLSYVVCWMPCVVFILIVYHDDEVFGYRKRPWFIAVRFVFINFLPHFNSTLNPFIYVISNKEFVSAMFKLFRALLRRTGLPASFRVGQMRRKKQSANTCHTDLLTLFDKEFRRCLPMKR